MSMGIFIGLIWSFGIADIIKMRSLVFSVAHNVCSVEFGKGKSKSDQYKSKCENEIERKKKKKKKRHFYP